MRHLLVTAGALLVALAAVARQPAPKPQEIAKLVEQLGADGFADREAATKRLEELGSAAIGQLRLGTRSENAETARRAQELLRKAERRLASEKTLAPTLVELDAKGRALDDVLADLSEQAKCEVVLGGAGLAELAAKKVTLSTGGKVPFWAAVLEVCDAAKLQIASAGGFLAPGAVPSPRPRLVPVRVAKDANRAVVLEARGKNPRRPAAVAGAVLVEAVPFPNWADAPGPAVLIQVWPEPRLQWQSIGTVRLVAAAGPGGERLAPDAAAVTAPKLEPTGADGVFLVRNPDGTVRVVRDAGGLQGIQTAGSFAPNPRQAVLRFKPGEKPAAAAKELSVSVFATVRSGFEPLCTIKGLEANKRMTATGPGGTELAVTCSPNPAGRLIASVQLSHHPQAVQRAGVDDELPGTVAGGPGVGNSTVYGLRVTDADGKPYMLGLESGATFSDRSGKWVGVQTQLGLHAGKDGVGAPESLTFWGTYLKPVEVPVVLKDVPLAGRTPSASEREKK
jgi:hypothetical protein